MIDPLAINWLAVAVATVVSFMLGGLWYGPVFGSAWLARMEQLGKRREDYETGSPAPFVISFFTSLISAIVIAGLVQGLQLHALTDGLLLGLGLGVGVIATSMASDTAFSGTGWSLWAIQAGYRAAYTVISAVILTFWQ